MKRRDDDVWGQTTIKFLVFQLRRMFRVINPCLSVASSSESDTPLSSHYVILRPALKMRDDELLDVDTVRKASSHKSK